VIHKHVLKSLKCKSVSKFSGCEEYLYLLGCDTLKVWWKFTNILKEGTASSLRVKECAKQAMSKKYTELCLLLAQSLTYSSWWHCVIFNNMVTTTRTSNPISWFPLLGKKILVEPHGLLIIFVPFFASTISQVLVAMVFLANDNIQPSGRTLTAVWDVMPCGPVEVTNVSEEYTAYIFRIQE
jgi:hypothetical protein